MGWTFYNASGQQLRATADKAATQAEMEAGSSTAAYVTPGRAQFHPAVAKAWAEFQIDATITSSYNVASITDNGAGDWTVVIDTDMSSVNYCVQVTIQGNAGTGVGGHAHGDNAVKVAASVRVAAQNDEGAAEDPGGTDYGCNVVIFGDQ